MRRLISLEGMDGFQRDEIVDLLTREKIVFREIVSAGVFLGGGAIMVADDDFVRARQLLGSEVQAFAATQRAKWRSEWVHEHGGSYGKWFFNRLRRHPIAVALSLFALAVMLWIFLYYPASFVWR